MKGTQVMQAAATPETENSSPLAKHADRVDQAGRTIVFRHSFMVRIMHWINAICIPILIVTGIFILMAHPRLYWGEEGFFDQAAIISFSHGEYADQLGWSRSLHFFCAWLLTINLLLYLLVGLIGGHIRKNLLPRMKDLKWDHFRHEFIDHLRLKIARGDAAREYNLFQRMAYLAVFAILIPIVILSGLTMSPAITASFPELFWLFDGRQSARTVHFFAASALLLFFIVHLFQVFLIGAVDAVRGMITGWYALPEEKPMERSET
jgi:thiosulfate reductase cytochrome b subunit